MASTFTSILARPGDRPRSDRTQHQVTCSQCGVSTTVPFRPSKDKPVYCQNCFRSRRQNASESGKQNGAGRGPQKAPFRSLLMGSSRDAHSRPFQSNLMGSSRNPQSSQSRNNANGAVRDPQSRQPRINANGAVRDPQSRQPRTNANGAARDPQSRQSRTNANGAVRDPQSRQSRNHANAAERDSKPQRQSPRQSRPEPTTPVAVAPETWTIGSAFSDMPLSPATNAAIARMGITEPTPIQDKAIPPLMQGRDLIGQARTGSGKTLAFAVPLAERCDPALRRIQALVLVPTRELAIQVAGVVEALAAAHKLRVTLLYGGRSLGPEYIKLRSGVQIVIGTPGRTLDHLRQGTLDLSAVRFLVLDEADEMLDRGFAHDVEAIMAGTPKNRQTALLSATMPAWVAQTAAKHLREPARAEVDAGLQAPPTVEHLVYSIQKNDKMNALRTLLDRRDDAPVIVFGRTKHGVKKLAKQLEGMGYPVGALQGNLSQNARERVMTDFRSGAASILVATNVAARGLDFESIGQVINFDLPDSEQLFTHRVGRTGRMGRTGEAITFITAEEETKWREIERGLGRRFSRQPWPAGRQPAPAQ